MRNAPDVSEHPRLLRVFRTVVERSADGSMAWDRGEHSTIFRAAFRSARVSIESEERDERATYAFRIYRPDGEVIDELRTGSVQNMAGEERDGRKDLNKQLRELYETARRAALQINDVYDSLEQELRIGAPDGEV